MFFDDAKEASRVLEITLTKRDAKKENPIPMCGVPYHSADNYIETLINKGIRSLYVNKWKIQSKQKEWLEEKL